MQRLNDILEAASYLKQGDIVTCNGKDQFVYKNKKVYHYGNGSHFILDLKEFVDLYKNNSFYLYEEPFEIDDKKDEEYYRYYKK